MLKDYVLICREVPEFKKFDVNKYMYFRALLNSRIYSFVIKQKRTLGLVPYADMINHKDPGNCEWYYDNEKKGFVISATNNIKKGEEVVLSYG